MNYPELVSILKSKIMKTLNFEKTREFFAEFALSNYEMINVRGGRSESEGVPIVLPPVPPIKI